MQSLFSEHWHVVHFLTPKLRDNVQVLPRRLRGVNWILLHDPMTHRFVKITPQTWQIIKLMDGLRTLELIWDIACEQATLDEVKQNEDSQDYTQNIELGQNKTKRVISQNELVQLLGQLYSNDLLQTQVSADAEEMFERFKKQKFAKLKQSFLNPISIKIPLFYPDPWFDRQQAFAKLLFSKLSFVIWLLVTSFAVIMGIQNWDGLTNNLTDRVLSSSNLFILWFTYPIVKAIHESAHGLAIKAWGGNVREMGLMFILFIPIPYVDASASYHFPSKWARAMVSAAGIFAELFLGAIAIYVWTQAESGLVHAIAFNVILIAGVSTVLVNGNPLMRYDGYFILSDLLEIPNLAQRSTQYLVYLTDRYIFGATDAKPPLASSDEKYWLMSYGLISPVYRMLIMIGLIWFVAQKYFFLGIILAIISAVLTILMPLFKGLKHVYKGGSLARYRETAQRRLWQIIIALFVFLTLVPMPYYSMQQAVVWLPDEAFVRAQSEGHIRASLVKPHQIVNSQQLILQLDNQKLNTDWQLAGLKVKELQVKLRQSYLDDVSQYNRLLHDLEVAEIRLQELDRQIQFLTVKSLTTGEWVPAENSQLQGLFVKRGDLLGYVINQSAQRLRVAVTQEDLNLILSRLKRVDARFSYDLSKNVAAHINRQIPQGQDTLVSAALGSSAGGIIPVDPSEQKGTKTISNVFDLELLVDEPSPTKAFGERAYVRFDLGWSPLVWQWSYKLRQLFLEKFYV